MKPIFFFRVVAICAALASLGTIPMNAAQPQTSRQVLDADSGWRFLLGDPSGAEARQFADGSWRTVNLPHDWSIEGVPDKDNPTAAGGGFFPGGTGWYRKTFTAPKEWKGKRVSVEFDGVYKDATVYLNGSKLGTHPYGYTSFSFDLTPGLDFSGPNVLAVRVDNSAQPNSRWYSGSGIYRHVRVVVTDPTHVAHWGVFVTTPEVSDSAAKVSLRTRVVNESADPAKVTVKTTLADRTGKPGRERGVQRNHRAGKRDRSKPGDRRRQSCAVVAGVACFVPGDYASAEERQSRGRSRDPVRYPVALVVCGKGTGAERQEHQAHRRQRSPRQRTAGSRGVRSRRGAQGRAAEGGWAQCGANGAQPAIIRISGRVRPARASCPGRAVRHVEGEQGQVRLRQRL